jgi:hypothetical protein
MRFITPVGMTLVLAFVTLINTKIDKLDDKVFRHLTNDEIHSPRSQFVENTKFELYQKMRDAQIESNEKTICEIKAMILDISSDLKKTQRISLK